MNRAQDAGRAAALEELCARCGIEAQYCDVWNQPHEASEATRIAILRAMGIDVADAGDALNAIDRLDEAEWRRTLPAAQVVRENEAPPPVPLVIPEPHGRLAWFLEPETGERIEGEIAPATLVRVQSREVDGRALVKYEWSPPVRPDAGYHVLGVVVADRHDAPARMRLIACPPACHSPEVLDAGGRLWGPAIQLYAVRSARNWGMGDFGDLRVLVDVAAQAGAGFIGLNPLHALDPGRPRDASPYNPSSRTAQNVLYLDVEAVSDFDACDAARRLVASDEFRAALAALRATELVDYEGVAKVKFQVLELLYGQFREQHLSRVSARADAFRAFQSAGGKALRLHALHDALQEYFAARDASAWGWPAWPEEYRDCGSAAVEAFERAHLERVEYFEYLQWQADAQLGAARRHAAARGLAIGFYKDLAVGASAGGSETWSHPGLHAPRISIGAPPDEFNPKGQDWGLAPALPRALENSAYQPYVEMLRAAMRHAGALRIDHVMGLMRLYWVPARDDPEGRGPQDGAYVRYPFQDLLGILALESRRNRCLIIGEDLGTVPDLVRREMAVYAMLSYRPLYFERAQGGAFKRPREFPREALVTVSTHDLPTLEGFWRGADLAVRQALDLFPSDEVRQRMILERAEDRARLVLALEQEGLETPEKSINDAVATELDFAAVNAVHGYLARTPSKIMAIQMEDVLGQIEQVNMPATWGDAYPNWRRKLPLPLESWRGDTRFEAIAATLGRERGYQARSRPRASGASPSQRTVPRATYRLQFSRAFRFTDATRVVPYLAALGISHVYASSYLKARPGSSHGYDIVDHNAFNPEIGTEEEFEDFVDALRAHGMNQMLDLVPNHMGVLESDNAWWLDVLENGAASRYAPYFDIDWEPANADLRGKVLLPVLGQQYGTALEAGELKLAFDAAAGEFSLHYYRHRFPIDPREYPSILGTLDSAAAAEEEFAELRGLLSAFAHLPAREELSPEKVGERARDKELYKRGLAALCRRSPGIAGLVAGRVAALNGTPGESASFDALHGLIEAQAFKLAHWRVASDDINYRRFFDINDLAALRMESEAVFEDTHRLVLRLVGEGKVEALRIDHPDGLLDPRGYFERLQARAAAGMNADGTGDPQRCDPPGHCIYLVVEKILASHERLPEEWPVDGTTGYRFANVATGLFVDTRAESEIDRTYAAFIGGRHDYAELVRDSKRLIMNTSLASELNVLSGLLNRIAKSDRRYRDFTLNSLRRALYEIVASFPVYRTYITAPGPRDEDLRYIDWAVGIAKKRAQAADTSAYDFVRAVLAGTAALSDPACTLCATFIGRFQQFTAPVMAKATEDTVFYIYNRLVALNEVGGDPEAFGMSLNAFHAASADRAKSWPHTILATSTHDSKRSEDVRTRIAAISEMPAEWRKALGRWERLNRRAKLHAGGAPAPSRNDEYLLYQTLLGAWPLGEMDAAALEAFRARIQAYMQKAVREAKVRTSWMNPDEDYERALASFIDSLLAAPETNAFLKDFAPFRQRIAQVGLLNSLSQTLVKLASPGVPDLYQGTELWDFSLVDPDNRRPVDYPRRIAMLDELQRTFAGDAAGWPERLRGMLAGIEDGRIKLYCVWRALGLRERSSGLFAHGSYVPVPGAGDKAAHVCAFWRRHEDQALLAVAPRLIAQLAGEERFALGAATWGDTRIELPEAATSLRDELTGRTHAVAEHAGKPTLRLAEVLDVLPVALLTCG